MEKLWPASENQSYTSFFLYKYLTACVNDQFLSSFLLRLSNLFDDGAFLLGNYLQPNHINHPLACLLYTDIIPLSQHQSYFFQCPIRAFPQLVCLLKNTGLATNQNFFTSLLLPTSVIFPCDLKQNGTQEKTTFSGIVCHALTHGVVSFYQV